MNSLGLLAAGFGAGLLAGGVSCAAVQAGLVAAAGRTPRSLGVFLTAKLVTHTLLGALLGAVGAAAQLGPRPRAILLLLAVVPLTLYAVRLFRRETACAPSTRATGRPALLGAATVLVPCGVTLSVELLAVTSRSAVGGAAALGGFVLGTAPLFGMLGLVAGALRGRLAPLVGVALLVVAGWTLLSGLRLGGWLPSSASATAIDTRFVRTDATGQTVTVWAADRGYRPALLAAHAGQPTTLVLRTDHTTGCTRVFVIPSRGVQRVLPVNGEVRIPLGRPKAGVLHFVCAAGHYPGSVTFR